MSYLTGPKRLIRNPITGEELYYTKGPKPDEPPAHAVAGQHSARVNELLGQTNRAQTSDENKSYFATSFGNSKPTTQNSSVEANASSIPMLNFTDLSAHRLLAAESVRSPILDYQQQVREMMGETERKTKPDSQIEAPRVPKHAFLNLGELAQPAVQKKESIYKVERVADLEKLWLTANDPQTSTYETKLEKENQLREKLVLDTVLTDQLSNLSTNPNNFIYTSRGNRILSTPRNTLVPNCSLSENVLSKRCKFNCRIKTTDGKLAMRELFGILFLHDGSLTIYEFRLLCSASFTGSSNMSKKANALPLLNRKVYTHAFGRRKGLNIEIWDIYNGATIYLACNKTLPGSLKDLEFIELEISDVDEKEKESLLISLEQQNASLSKDILNQNIELNDRQIVQSVRKFMCKQIENRSVEVYMGLSKFLKQKQGALSQQDFHDALIKYNIQIHSEDLGIVWQVLDLNGTGALSYYTLMRGYFGEMNNHRFFVFRSLVNKLDTQKIGYVQVSALNKFFQASRHPKVKSGDLTENEMMRQFLGQFDLLNPLRVPDFNEISTSMDTKTPLIAYDQLEEYYNGLSIQVAADSDFIQILKNSWNLV